ncbi:MAG TPA: hypothetical protein VFK34_11865 [Marmoricola sp.]|nr:hypothetical protein [Marmoricola sp.]
MSSRPLRIVSTGLAAGALLLSAACGSAETEKSGGTEVQATPVTPSTSETGSPSPSATPDDSGAKTVEVHFTEDSVEPLGKVVKLDVGQKLVLDIDAEVPGEMHVHSTPEQEIAYPAGESQAEIVIDRPGVVEVESHTLDKLVLQLEVR